MRRVILVTGSREYTDRAHVYRALDANDPLAIMHGGASGADALAAAWARSREVPALAYPAPWRRAPRSAGPWRNQAMLDLLPQLASAFGATGHVMAFPGGRGTAHMVDIAQRAGVPVIRATEVYPCL